MSFTYLVKGEMPNFSYLSRKRRDVQVVSCFLGLSSYVTENTSHESMWAVMTNACYLCPIEIKIGLCSASRKTVVRNQVVTCDRDTRTDIKTRLLVVTRFDESPEME